MMNTNANIMTMPQLATGNAHGMNLNNINANLNNNNNANVNKDEDLLMTKQWKLYGNDVASSSSAMNKDSLLGMASSLLDVDLFRSMLAPPSLEAQQRMNNRFPAARPEDITSQVLAELSEDLFADSSDLFGSDALEPIPVNPNRMNVVNCFGPASSATSSLHQLYPSRYSLLEGTLSQVLNQGNNNHVNMMVPVNDNNDNNNNLMAVAAPDVTVSLKREVPDILTTLPAFKKQRLEAPEDDGEDDPRRFRPYQAEQWTEKFGELVEFRKAKGHCCVPHTYKENPALARWVKRQRYQYKLKNEAKQSTMTDERVEALENIGFIWDSHGAAWAERLNELKDYRQETGHCNVPSNYPSNPQLATWVKCQRRQYKLFWDGKTSNMTLGRISGLEEIGFEWELRAHHNKSTSTTYEDDNNKDDANNDSWPM